MASQRCHYRNSFHARAIMYRQRYSREVGVDGQDVWVIPGCDVALEDGGSNSAVQAQ